MEIVKAFESLLYQLCVTYDLDFKHSEKNRIERTTKSAKSIKFFKIKMTFFVMRSPIVMHAMTGNWGCF